MDFGSHGGHTIKITYKIDGIQKEILTGSSYKNWYTQAVEFFYRAYGSPTMGWRFEDLDGRLEIVEVEKSFSRWIGWGGLKWSSTHNFQEELNREGVQRDEPDNPKARQFSKFKFQPYNIGYRKLIKELQEW